MLGSLRYIISAALVAILFVGAASVAQAKSTIYLIRHAEKQDDGTRDPSLTEVGKSRALWLADWFADKGVTAIYSTELKRTLETVTPLSERLNMPISPYDPRALEAVATRLRAEEGVIVVSGHSNTTPELVNLLIGEMRYPELEEAWMYDHIFQVMLDDATDKEGRGASVEIHYSEPRSILPAAIE